MKRLIMIFLGLLIVGALSAQTPNTYRYPVTIGMGAPGTVTGGVLNLRGLTSGSVQLKSAATAGTGTIFQFPNTNGINGSILTTSGSGVTSWTESINAGTLQPMNSDTTALFGVSGGNGLSGSQSSFLLNADLGGLAPGDVKDTTYITSARLFVKQDSGTVTMGCRFFKHATTWPTSASTDMMSNVITLSAATNATTTGTIITHTSTPHFDTFVVYPGESVALIVTVKSNGNMPVMLRGDVYGYTQNRKY